MKRLVTNKFNEEKQNVLRAIRDSNVANVLQNAVSAVDIDAWKELYESFYSDVMLDFGKRTVTNFKSIGSIELKISEEDNPFDDLLFEVNEFIEDTTEQRAKEVTDTTKKRITEIIIALLLLLIEESEEETENGLLMGEIEEEIGKLYDHDTPIRSRAIGQTEVITAGNAATFYVARSLDAFISQKQWHAVIDNRTRQSHRELNGEIVNMIDTYSNGLRFPGDPLGSAAETINCRCIETYLF